MMNCEQPTCVRDWNVWQTTLVHWRVSHCDTCHVVTKDVQICEKCDSVYCLHCHAFTLANTCKKCEPILSKEQLSWIATPEMCVPTELDNQHNTCPLNLAHCKRDKSTNLWHCNCCHSLEAYQVGTFCKNCKGWRCYGCLEDDLCEQCCEKPSML
jgi:hypothetical protein